MLIILRGFRCSLILKTGPAKGVPLEQSKKAVFVKDFFRKLTFWGAGAILRKSAPAASWGIGFSALQGAQSFFIQKAKVLLIIFVGLSNFPRPALWRINMGGIRWPLFWSRAQQKGYPWKE